MNKWRKRPVIIEAVQFLDRVEAMKPLADFLPDGIVPQEDLNGNMFLIIPTLEGDHRANEGDYIIRGVKGEFYPCKPDIFHMTYEKVQDE